MRIRGRSQCIWRVEWGWGGLLNKVLYEEAPPRGPTPYPFIYRFDRKLRALTYTQNAPEEL